MIHFSDRAIVEGLKLNSDYIIKHVYQEFFPTIKYLIKKNTGNEEDAEDIFQESLIVVLKNVQKEDFYLSCSFLTYLYSISRNLWMQRLKAKKKDKLNMDILDVFFDFPDVNSAELAEAEQLRYRIYREHFNAMEKDCQRILLLSMQKFSSKDIADTMGYGSENYAKTKKYNCKERLKRSIMGDPRIQDLHD
ncbi:MAG: sigma-70 family RNA polymerase sigma factor [Lentimicrobium sp.]|jgi:RNA polymerase sigma factor (sigma-70 family)|nr:sigma-70 family RNA polymerase sigma factor [Lentimicrobium sp.]MDD2527966.1 sigma-70 family RNA polymerase sigma factor [Lentimicrobiaceae bacterium]MDD4598174.1 sigma-70 family RNA polymerase sigma factor [Lentimicrobiaceae bacterium]MDY0026082.1 sigma-70 family RNA polymerase sigma factor [Lentimicrobium sp.]